MGNPETARKDEKMQINCIIAVAPELMNKIEARNSGSMDNDLGVSIETSAPNHTCEYDPETGECYRDGKKLSKVESIESIKETYNKRKQQRNKRAVSKVESVQTVKGKNNKRSGQRKNMGTDR